LVLEIWDFFFTGGGSILTVDVPAPMQAKKTPST
jgi:hypothetical protein